jgi:fused signal recognition particle receptor
MSKEKKPGFLQRWFGIGGGEPRPEESPPPAKKEPGSPAPKKEPPSKAPAKKEPPSRKKPPKEAGKPRGGKKVPPPAGPTPTPGEPPPDERYPADREKQEPGPSHVKTPPPPKRQKDKPKGPKAPPPAGPANAPGAPKPEDMRPSEREKEKPKQEGAAGRPSHQSRPAEPKRSWFRQLRQGLARTSNALSDDLASALTKRKLDDEVLDQVEDVLIKADLGVAMAGRIRAALAKGRYDRGLSPEDVSEVLAAEIAKVLKPLAQPFALHDAARPHVLLVVGVNGTGKTTTIGKMAHQFSQSGLSVMLAAADTFRAAAIDQLKVWGGRVGADVIAKEVGSDPAGVAYEALERSREAGNDVLLVDTAGRLQNKSDLMGELAKIVRVLKKLDDAAPHGVVLILDATTGQNAINQVATFQEIAGVTSLVVTKLDGTARGGILVAIAERFKLPINAIGIGEGLDDLEPFDADDFARAIAGAKTLNEQAA